jgi:chitinase
VGVREGTVTCARRRAIVVVLALVLLGAPTAGPASAALDATHGAPARMLMGYYVGYERDLMPPEEIDWAALTHLAVGVVLPRRDGRVDLRLDLGPGEGPALARDLAERAHANGVVPILMIGGAGAHDAFRSAASPKHRRAFVRTLVAAMRNLGYDGLDLDWEPMNADDRGPFKALVTALRRALPGAVLTAPAEITTLTFPSVRRVYREVAAKLDRINLMTYGMEGPYPGWRSWHSSALDGASEETPTSVAVAVRDYLAAGIPARKLGVGIGFFGDCWTEPVTGPGQPLLGATIAATDWEMSYTTIVTRYFSPEAARFDPVAQVPYLTFPAPTGPKRCTYISYEDEASIAAKGAWARARGLGGAIVWTINQAHDRGAPAGQRDALLSAARVAFGA